MKNRSSLRSSVLRALMLAIVLLVQSCASGPVEPGDTKSTITTTIWGTVMDEQGIPVQGASVTGGSISAVTDAKGVFILRNVQTPADRCFVIVKKAGYFTASRAETPVKNGATRMKLSLMSNQSTVNINGATGGTVNISGGASVAFQAGSFKKSDGSSYNGTVKVAARYLNPDNLNFYEYFSGDYTALTSENKEVQLISCGVLRVELKGTSGETLTLDSDKPATLTYPVPTSQQTAPSSIPLWYFDETSGMWKEDGSAALQSGKYVGTVTHFTDWNLDYKQGENGTVQMRIVCDGIPIPNVAVKVGGFFHITGYSDQSGIVRFVRVPADKEIEIFIRAEDNNGLYFINTPVKAQLIANGELNIGDITLNSPCPAAITGNVTGCDERNIDALVLVSWASGSTMVYTPDGNFKMPVPAEQPLTVYVTDPGGNEVSVDLLALASGEKRNIGAIRNCGTGTPSYIDIALSAGYSSIALSNDGAYLFAVNTVSNTIAVFDAATGTLISEIPTGLSSTSGYAQIDMSNDNSKIILSSQSMNNTTVYTFDGTTLTHTITIPRTYSGKILDDGTAILAVNRDINRLSLYSSSDGTIIKTISYSGSDSLVLFSIDEQERAVIFLNRDKIDVWSIDNDNMIRSMLLNSPHYGLYTNNDGSIAAATVQNYMYSLYNTITGVHIGDKVFTSRDSGSSFFSSGVVLGSTMVVVPGITQNALSLQLLAIGTWNVRSVKLVPGTVPKPMDISNSIALSRNEKRLAAMFGDKLRIWTLN